jgi:hypothetical protein
VKQQNLKYLTEIQLDNALRYMTVYEFGSMLRDVFGYDRAQAKEAFLYWVESKEHV